MNDIEKYIAEMEEQKSRLKEWLSSENLEYAKGKTREEIFNLFDNTPLPIAMLPLYYLQFFNDTTDDNKIYSGKAYYLDHAVNHHPDVNIDVYLNLQEIFLFADEVIYDKRVSKKGNKKDNLIFIKKYEENRAAVISLEQGNDKNIIFHKSLQKIKNKPYPSLPRIRPMSVGGVSTISHIGFPTPGGSLSALDNSNIALAASLVKIFFMKKDAYRNQKQTQTQLGESFVTANQEVHILNRDAISSKENTMSQNRTQEENSQKNQDAMQTNPHFLDRVGDVLTAVQSTVLPTLPTDIEWDIDKMGNLGNVYGFCEPDNLSERYAMISVAPDIPTTIEASLRYTLDADALEPLVRRRLDNPSEHFTSFDHELLSSWLDLENASMLAFSEQYDKDPSVQNLLHDWPMDDFEQDYRLSLNEKREIARKILTIEDNVQQFCRQNGNEEYLDQYHYCKTDIVDDEQHTEIKVTLDFRNGTSGAADICLAYATGSHEYVEPQMVVAKVTAEQLASKDSIQADIVEALDRNIGTQKRTESKDEKLTYADFLELHQNDDNFAENLRNHMENSADFAKEAFVTEMNAHKYSPQSPQADFDVCKNFGKLQDNSSPKFEQGKSGQSYLKDMGYSQNVCDAYEDAKKHVALQDKARDALNFENVLDTWARDCAENNFSEKGTWALCVDVSARMAFKDFSPGKHLSPIDQDTVIVSFYKPSDTPKDAKELSAKMDAIKREAVWNSTEVLVNRQKQQEAREKVQEKEERQTLREEQRQKKGRGR